MREKEVKHKRKESLGRRIFLAVNGTFLVIFALFCLVPFFNLLAISLSDAAAVDAGDVGLIPVDLNFTAYKFLFQKREFWNAFGYSVARVILGTILSSVIVPSGVMSFSFCSFSTFPN